MPINNILYQPNPLFTCREGVLERHSAALKSDKAAAKAQPQAISGLGGIGIMQTAVKYAYRNQHNYEAGAIFDITGSFRYSLWRAWSPCHPRIAFILLNPSTADEHKNDPTIRCCKSFARAWDFGSVEVVNLFAYRATDYRDLFKANNPIGAENDRFLMQAVERCSTIVLGWGARGTFLNRARQVMSLLIGRNDLYCLGITRNGQPRHPLYVRVDSSLVPFNSSV